MEVAVSSLGVVQEEDHMVAWGSLGPSFPGDLVDWEVQEWTMVAAYLVEVGVEGNERYPEVIHQAVNLESGWVQASEAVVLEEEVVEAC